MDTTNERSVYKWTQAIDIKDSKIQCIDTNDNVILIGDKKGYVTTYDEQVGPRKDGNIGSQFEYVQLNYGKRGQSEINQIILLTKSMMIALLSNNVINIVECTDLSSVQEIKKKVHMFCINNQVYQADMQSQKVKGSSNVIMDEICAVTLDKTLVFYEFTGLSNQFKFEETNKQNDKGITVGGSLPNQIIWDGDQIYLANKKNYIIMSKSSGTILQSVLLINQPNPQMCLYKNKCLILNENNQGFFMDQKSGQKKNITFQFEKYLSGNQLDRGQIIQIIMHEIYVIVIFETSIDIFNAQTGDFLEQRGTNIDKFRYKQASLNHITGDIVIVAHNTQTLKNSISTKIYKLQEIPAQDQINYLLQMKRIQEAKDIFMLKVNKADNDFSTKSDQFFLDCGWIRFINMLDFKESLNDFKSTNLDPRELIFMFKDLLIEDQKYKKHFNGTDAKFDLQKNIENISKDNPNMNINTISKIEEAKLIIAQILEHKNRTFIPDLKKNPNKTIKFQYSNFSPFYELIKKDISGGILLVDVVTFIQTNLIKLYVQKGNTQLITDFFNSPANKKQIYIDSQEIEEFLARNEDKKISVITMALIYENTDGKYELALQKWQQLRNEQACQKTVSILKKSFIDKQCIFKYLKWVLEFNPEIGLQLFFDKNIQSNENKSQDQSNSGQSGGAPQSIQSSNVIERALDKLSHEEILEYLNEIEQSKQPDLNLMTKRKEELEKIYPYRERYLEYILQKCETSETYETMLAELYIDKMFQIQEREKEFDDIFPELINPRRKKLQDFLDKKKKYDPSILLEKIKDSWMTEEEIILLVKKKQYEPAIQIFVNSEQFLEAELFCTKRPELELMNTLLKVYIDSYNRHNELKINYSKQKLQNQVNEALAQSNIFKKQALDLLKKYSCSRMLNPTLVVAQIPDEWEIQNKDYDFIQYLKNMYDSLLTTEENQKISSHLSNIEILNQEKNLNELKQSYIVIEDNLNMCKVCNRVLKSQQYFKVYPDGGIYHTYCAKDKSECPITKQKFDFENQILL